MSIGSKFLAAAAMVVLGATSSAWAATVSIDFTGNSSGNYGADNSRTFSNGGVTVTAKAFSMVTADQLDLTMDFDSLKKAGTGLGSAGVIVVDDATCMVALTLKFSNFFKAESCGQCPPCRMGTINLAALRTKIEQGEGTEKDMQSLLQICGFVKGTGYCTLVTGAAVLVQSSIKLFRHEFEEHVRLQRCPHQPVATGATVH